ncbi:hypothetical protein [Pseudaestuariivita sp.]|uniref:hypothetical protein n=1 Tax=Pseudaestuariivita sp. TaxID=2211669 RepID=UPI004059DD7A
MSAVDKAREAWGSELPDWVEAMAVACDDSSQNQVAKRIGRSSSVVSHVLRNAYPGDMAATEELVRGTFMSGRTDCPALGKIPSNECRLWRERAKSFSSHNAQRVQMFRACRRCPVNRGAK